MKKDMDMPRSGGTYSIAKALQDPAEMARMLESQLRQQPGMNLDQSEVLRIIRALRGRLGE
jgi:hypothetical protein